MQVDLSNFDPEALEGIGVISDQIAIADILVGSKADLATGAAGTGAAAAAQGSEALAANGGADDASSSGGEGGGEPVAAARFRRWAAGLYPPKSEVAVISGGGLDVALLDRPRAGGFATLTASWRGGGGGRGRRQGGPGGGGSSGAVEAGLGALQLKEGAGSEQQQQPPQPQ